VQTTYCAADWIRVCRSDLILGCALSVPHLIAVQPSVILLSTSQSKSTTTLDMLSLTSPTTTMSRRHLPLPADQQRRLSSRRLEYGCISSWHCKVPDTLGLSRLSPCSYKTSPPSPPQSSSLHPLSKSNISSHTGSQIGQQLQDSSSRLFDFSIDLLVMPCSRLAKRATSRLSPCSKT